ncbi:MAG: glutathione S-transferase family protein [Alphaproteobacteria bacterium]|nr:glutathione S-transferase family protein [Alphaproteobacteria bacterium]
MGMLVDGRWTAEDEVKAKTDKSGRFNRAQSVFRNWVSTDGSAGPSGEGGYAAAPGRYHLYIAMNCPWAHRTALMRKLKKLDDVITLDHVLPRRDDRGWVFDNSDAAYRDTELGKDALHEVYMAADPQVTGRVTVPVLWDRERETIVNNESAEIIRMMNGAFDAFSNNDTDFYPEDLQGEIDSWNELTYNTLNNGVYRSGFAQSQAAYDEAVVQVFATLDKLEAHLADNRYLCGDRFTEADIRAFPTLIRFDVAYFGAFKCNLRRLMDYPNVWAYTREIYQMPGVAETCDLDVFKRGYYSPSPQRNPLGIVPLGPIIDPMEPHGRG